MTAPEIKRGTTYTTTFTITELPGGTPLDLTGATAKYAVEDSEFAASIDAPATLGKVSVALTPAQTATLDRGRRQAWCDITFADTTVRAYGEHTIEVRD